MIFSEHKLPPGNYAIGSAYFSGRVGRQGVKASWPCIQAIHCLDEARRRFGHLFAVSRLPRASQRAPDNYQGDSGVIVRHWRSGVAGDALRLIVSLVKVELG